MQNSDKDPKDKQRIEPQHVYNSILNVNTRIDSVHERIDALHDKTDVGFQEMRQTINKKFDGHNDYHVKLERKWFTWFKVLLLSFTLFVGFILSGMTKSALVELFPVFVSMWKFFF